MLLIHIIINTLNNQCDILTQAFIFIIVLIKTLQIQSLFRYKFNMYILYKDTLQKFQVANST